MNEHLDTTGNLIEAFLNSDHLRGSRFNKFRTEPGHDRYILDAAERRGLEIRKIGIGKYFFRNGNVVGASRSMVTTLTGSIAVSACASKLVTKELLTAANVPTPRGAAFRKTDHDGARKFAQSNGTVVIKPSKGAAGEGVSVGVSSAAEFDQAWEKAVAASGSTGSDILIEEVVRGLDIRAYVVGDKVVAAATRLPPYVIGNGRRTVAQLVEARDAQRSQHAYLKRMPTVVSDAALARAGHSLTSKPARGELVVLNETVNLHQGGENVDITAMMSLDLKALAVRATKAIPSLGAAGIDLMVRHPSSVEGAVVLEANTKANISVHHRPAYGESIDVGGALIDEMIRRADAAIGAQ